MTGLLKKHYKGKKVFLTGHTGFKGSWMVMVLKWLGADVKGYALYPDSFPNLYTCVEAEKKCDSVIADIRNKELLKKEIMDYQPDFIFHLAAQSLVIPSYLDPIETYEVNTMGTVYLLDAVREMEKKCQVVVITTDKVYENLEREEPYREEDRLGGFDPYSNSKACAELVAKSYRSSFFNPEKYDEHYKCIATARSGNVIGGGDWSENRIIPDLVKAFSEGQKLKLRNPKSVRPWQHVLEPLGAYLLLGAKMETSPLQYGDEYNFGPKLDDTLTVEELVKEAKKIWNEGDYEFSEPNGDFHEAGLLRLSIEKAKIKLGWEPVFNAKTAIENTINWYKNTNEDNYDEFTNTQIEKYFKQYEV